jgi:hypothetical protein
MINFLVVDPNHARLAVGRDRLAEACLLQALRARAGSEEEQRAAAEETRRQELFLMRELLQSDLVDTFGVSTLSLLHVAVVDGREEGDDARALLSFRFPYELRPNRRERLWVLAMLSASGEVATYFAANKLHSLQLSWPMSTRGAAAPTELWCAIAELAAQSSVQ